MALSLHRNYKTIIKMDTVNKIALVTGGSRGLGKNMALSIAKKGIDGR